MAQSGQVERREYTRPVVRVIEIKPEERLMACNKLPFSACTTQKDS